MKYAYSNEFEQTELDGTVIFTKESGDVVVCNETASFILALLTESDCDKDHIVKRLVETYDVSENEACEGVDIVVSRAEKLGILTGEN